MKVNNDSRFYVGCVFLGGTCGCSTWREKLIGMLKFCVPYFNPQVTDWTPEDAAREDACKPLAKLNVFVITGDTLSTYSGYEVAEEANSAPEKLVFCALGPFPENQEKGIKKIKKELIKKGCTVCESLEEVAKIINNRY